MHLVKANHQISSLNINCPISKLPRHTSQTFFIIYQQQQKKTNCSSLKHSSITFNSSQFSGSARKINYPLLEQKYIFPVAGCSPDCYFVRKNFIFDEIALVLVMRNYFLGGRINPLHEDWSSGWCVEHEMVTRVEGNVVLTGKRTKIEIVFYCVFPFLKVKWHGGKVTTDFLLWL